MCVGREDVVSAPDFAMSSGCGVKFCCVAQEADKTISVKRRAE